jgi:hypothetical protein
MSPDRGQERERQPAPSTAGLWGRVPLGFPHPESESAEWPSVGGQVAGGFWLARLPAGVRFLAVDYKARSGDRADPDAREHVEADLGLLFWLHRTEPTD